MSFKKIGSVRNSSNRSRSNSNVNHTFHNDSENSNKPLGFTSNNDNSNNHDQYDNYNQEDENSYQNDHEQNRLISNNLLKYNSTIKNELNLTSIPNKLPVKNVNNSSLSSSSHNHHNNNSSNSLNNRRNRVFIDPISEVPILEHYFSIETYPDHYLIEKICENLNRGEYRYKFPKLESRNIQLWFKNHRAKLKRLKSTPSTPITANSQPSGMQALSTSSSTNNDTGLINMNRKGNGQPNFQFNSKLLNQSDAKANENDCDNNDDDEEEYGDYEIDDYESNQDEEEKVSSRNIEVSNNNKVNHNESLQAPLT